MPQGQLRILHALGAMNLGDRDLASQFFEEYRERCPYGKSSYVPCKRFGTPGL